jgi:hypothetical protein
MLAGGFVDFCFFICRRRFGHLLCLAASFRYYVVGIALCLIHDTGRIGAGAGHIAKRGRASGGWAMLSMLTVAMSMLTPYWSTSP